MSVDNSSKKILNKLNRDDEARLRVDKLSTRRKIFTSLVAGSIAGACAKTAIAPLDRAKINFQGILSSSSFTFYFNSNRFLNVT